MNTVLNWRLCAATLVGCGLFSAAAIAAESTAVVPTEATPTAADSTAATSTAEGQSGDAPAINVWVDSAPLSLMIEQLGSISGKQVTIDGELEGQVSGRFSGSLDETLERLSLSHGVLFDMQEGTLAAASQDESSSVSIALSEPAFADTLAQSLGSMLSEQQGNRIEFREDAVRISGHPGFVKRTAKLVTTTLGDVSAQENETLSDAGSQAMLQDIQEEELPASERASLTKPIRWVTDIPGFTTF